MVSAIGPARYSAPPPIRNARAADAVRDAGIPVFGPGARAARIEGSKAFAKEVMDAAGVPTAAWEAFTDEAEALGYVADVCDGGKGCVVKADGLAGELVDPEGVTVDVVENGAKAVDTLLSVDAGTFDMVLMDAQMPVMDGYEATRRIREAEAADASLGHVPVVALTANVFTEDVAASKAAGMDAHLGKPFEMDDLRRVAARLCGRAVEKGEGEGAAR